MANIAKLLETVNGKDVTDKLNEIIDWLNGTTEADRVTNVTVSGQTLTVIYINGDTEQFALPDTTYEMATTTSDGLMSRYQVYKINALTAVVSALNNACAAIEKANEAIEDAQEAINNAQPEDSGGDGGEGTGGDG